MKKRLRIVSLTLLCGFAFASPPLFGDEPTSTAPGKLKIKVTDAHGQLLPVRVHVAGPNNSFFMPADFAAELARTGAAKQWKKQQFFYCNGTTEFELASGEKEITLNHGFDFEPLREKVMIESGKTAEKSLVMQRLAGQIPEGWYACEAHLHRGWGLTPDFMLAEDLSVAMGGGCGLWHAQWGPAHPLREVPDKSHLIGGAQGIEGLNAHCHIWANPRPIDVTARPGIHGGPLSPSEREDENMTYYRTLIHLEAAHEAGGTLLAYAHDTRRWPISAYPVAIALGWVDTYGIFENYVVEAAMSAGEPKFHKDLQDRYSLWYRFLNCGFRLPATAGSDIYGSTWGMYAGCNRFFVHVGKEFSFEKFVQAMRAGRTFVTNRPLLFATVNGQDPGAELRLESKQAKPVELAINLVSATPVETIEIIENGKIRDTIRPPSPVKQLQQTLPIEVNQSCWLAVRCYGKGTDRRVEPPHVVAHTSPFYVLVDGKPIGVREDAKFMREFVEGKLKDVVPKLDNEDVRRYMTSTLEAAIARYAEIEK